MSVLFQALWLFNKNTKQKKHQLIIINGLGISGGFGGNSIGATLTPEVSKWLSKMPNNYPLSDIEETMMSADAYMWQYEKNKPHRFEFMAQCQNPKWIFFSIPNNACRLDPESRHDQTINHGYEFCPHNVDHPLQQLTFLMGLAKLHDLVRKTNP